MSPEERQLITSLFDRMRGYGAPEKDREAEALIIQSVRGMPDAPYMLVQSVLVQEQALQQADQRIQDLEDRVHELEEGRQAPAPGQGGGFLGGLFGGGSDRPAVSPVRTSVPAIGSRSKDYQSRSAWSPQNPPQAQAAPPASGGFMRSAMTTAAGVAGGMLLADSIRNMMGTAQANPASASGADKTASNESAPAATEAKDDGNKEPLYDQADANDRRTYDEPQNAAWDGGGDFGGGDIDV